MKAAWLYRMVGLLLRRRGDPQPFMRQKDGRRDASALPVANALDCAGLISDTKPLGNLGRSAKSVYSRRVTMKWFHSFLHMRPIKHHV